MLAVFSACSSRFSRSCNPNSYKLVIRWTCVWLHEIFQDCQNRNAFDFFDFYRDLSKKKDWWLHHLILGVGAPQKAFQLFDMLALIGSCSTEGSVGQLVLKPTGENRNQREMKLLKSIRSSSEEGAKREEPKWHLPIPPTLTLTISACKSILFFFSRSRSVVNLANWRSTCCRRSSTSLNIELPRFSGLVWDTRSASSRACSSKTSIRFSCKEDAHNTTLTFANSTIDYDGNLIVLVSIYKQ